jgi:hypothetical protein
MLSKTIADVMGLLTAVVMFSLLLLFLAATLAFISFCKILVTNKTHF